MSAILNLILTILHRIHGRIVINVSIGTKYSSVLEIFIPTDKCWTDGNTDGRKDGAKIIIFLVGDNNVINCDIMSKYSKSVLSVP